MPYLREYFDGDRPVAKGKRVVGINLMRNFFVTLVLSFLLASCDWMICGDEVQGSATSPDGKYVATVFVRNCGATTSYVTIVRLSSSRSLFNINSRSDWVFIVPHRSEVRPIWVGSKKLKFFFTSGLN